MDRHIENALKWCWRIFFGGLVAMGAVVYLVPLFVK
jgi:hypothetical protein